MAHANYTIEQASMRDVPMLLQLAEPFVTATKEHCLGEPPRVLHRGHQDVPFYELGVTEPVRQLEQLVEYANRGRP